MARARRRAFLHVSAKIEAGSEAWHKRHQPPRITTVPRGGFNPVEASRIQKLYNENQSKAMREILDDPSQQCPVSEGALFAHFHPEETKTEPPRSVRVRPTSTPTPGATQDSGHDLFHDEFTTDEVLAVLKKTKNTAPGPDRIRYLHWKKFDPGCYILARLFNCCRTLGQIPESWKTSRTVLIHKGEDLDVHVTGGRSR